MSILTFLHWHHKLLFWKSSANVTNPLTIPYNLQVHYWKENLQITQPDMHMWPTEWHGTALYCSSNWPVCILRQLQVDFREFSFLFPMSVLFFYSPSYFWGYQKRLSCWVTILLKRIGSRKTALSGPAPKWNTNVASACFYVTHLFSLSPTWPTLSSDWGFRRKVGWGSPSRKGWLG